MGRPIGIHTLPLPRQRFPDERAALRMGSLAGLEGLLSRILRRSPKLARGSVAIVQAQLADGRSQVDLVARPATTVPLWFEPLVCGPPALGHGELPPLRGMGYRDAAAVSNEVADPFGIASLLAPVARHAEAVGAAAVRACAWPYLVVDPPFMAEKVYLVCDWIGETYAGTLHECAGLGIEDPSRVAQRPSITLGDGDFFSWSPF